MSGLGTETSDTVKDVTDPAVRDIALNGAAQQVQRNEVAVYGTLRTWADLLSLDNHPAVLEAIETEEVSADEILTACLNA